MFDYNPFLERNFSSSSISSHPYDRHYFPYQPSKSHKPGFLIANQSPFPIVTSDIKSRHYKHPYKFAEKVKKSYVQNPFHKSNLLQDTDSYSRMYTSAATPSYSSYYGGKLYESNVRTVEANRSYGYYNPRSYYGDINYDKYDRQNSSSLGKKNSLQKKSSLGKNGSNGMRSKNYYDNPENSYENQKLLKKNSGGFNINSNLKKIDSGESTIYKIYKRSSKQQDDPLSYNYPSFSMKKQESVQSPTWPGEYRPLNEERDPYERKNYISNMGTQSNNIRLSNAPQQIQYQGRTFYLINTFPVDQL